MTHGNRGGKTFGVSDFYKSYIPVSLMMGKRVAKGSLLGTVLGNGDNVSAYLVVTDGAPDIRVTLSAQPDNGVREQAGVQRWISLTPVISAVLQRRQEAWDGYGSRAAYDKETREIAQEQLLDYLNKTSSLWRFDKVAAEQEFERLEVGRSPFLPL